MNLVERRQFTLKQVQDNDTIQHILSIEPSFQRILDMAAHPDFECSRWQKYEALKWMGLSLVGWSARKCSLRTSRHYETMIWAIDVLLPCDGEKFGETGEYQEQWEAALSAWRNRRGNDTRVLKLILLESGA